MKKIYKEPFYVILLFLKSCVRALNSYESLFFTMCFSLLYYILPVYTYFLFLGILSSIGFGTGIHTGTLVVFPKFANIATEKEDFKTAYFTAFPYAVIWGELHLENFLRFLWPIAYSKSTTAKKFPY